LICLCQNNFHFEGLIYNKLISLQKLSISSKKNLSCLPLPRSFCAICWLHERKEKQQKQRDYFLTKAIPQHPHEEHWTTFYAVLIMDNVVNSNSTSTPTRMKSGANTNHNKINWLINLTIMCKAKLTIKPKHKIKRKRNKKTKVIYGHSNDLYMGGY
jgi:hypothetical protein